jgi:hypothetical protein
MAAFLGISYWGGVLVSFFVFYARAGFSKVRAETGVDWREFLLPNLGYFVLYLVKVTVWPVPLVHWLATGRGPSPWTATTRDGDREVRAVVRTG